MKKGFLLFAICSLLTANCFAIDFSFRPKGFAFIPSGEGLTSAAGHTLYGMGGGGELGFEIDLATVLPNPLGIGYTLGIEGAVLSNEVKADEQKSVSLTSFGGDLGLYFFPLSRLLTRFDAAIGVYQPSFDGEKGYSGLFWRWGGELGFRFTPAFTVAANAGWWQFDTDSDAVFNSGVYTGLTAQITFQIGSGITRQGIGVNLDQYDEVYPVFMQLYQNNPIGNLVIRNNENADIRHVRVSFRSAGYTSSEYPCGTAAIIPRGGKTQMPLLADFSSAVLRFTDSGRILGEVVIRYRYLGREQETVRTVILATTNRNTVTVSDTAALAAFISPTSPDTLDYAKYISGLARTNKRIGHNQNFQYAVWLFEGLRAGGIMLGETYAADGQAQFPAETLSYGTGSSRDLALLFAASLESVGIPSAFVASGDDFLVSFSLGTNKSGAETLFNGTDKILIVNDEVWLPLSMNAFNDGFISAWTQGVASLKKTFEAGTEVDFVMVEEAWAVYPPAPLPEQGGRPVRTDAGVATNRVNAVMQQYIDQELQPIVRQVQGQINNNPTMALYNRLGIVQARTGRIADAKASYERAAGMGSIPAMTNRGNLALGERDYATAERFFRQALGRDSGNKAAVKGLEQVAGK